MSQQITKAFEQDWADTFIHLSQQKQSKLAMAVRMEQVNDAKAFHFDRLDSVIMQKAVSRHEDTPLTEVPYSRRRVTFNTFRAADLIDNPDRVKMSKDPTSPTMKMRWRGCKPPRGTWPSSMSMGWVDMPMEKKQPIMPRLR